MASSQLRNGIEPALATPALRMLAVVNALSNHYSESDAVSRSMVAAAGRELSDILLKIPPGIVYLTHSAKEGVYALKSVLGGDVTDFSPKYAIKRFENLSQASLVHSLTVKLRQLAEGRKKTGRAAYLKVPDARWPMELDDFAVVFMDALDGRNMAKVMPELDRLIQNGSPAATMIREYLVLSVLDDIAYWQTIAPGLAREFGYELEPGEVHGFLSKSVRDSAATLESVTDARLLERDYARIRNAADNLQSLVSPELSVSFDFGPRNIIAQRTLLETIDMIVGADSRESQPSLYGLHRPKVADSVWHVDVPHDFRTIHPVREAVRFLFGLSSLSETNPDSDEIDRYLAYVLLAKKSFDSTDFNYTHSAQFQRDLLLRRTLPPGYVDVFSSYRNSHPHDIYAHVVAEAGRMTSLIPNLFLSKIAAEQEGYIPQSTPHEELDSEHDSLVRQVKRWAAMGKEASCFIECQFPNSSFAGLSKLFEAWEKAQIFEKRLPRYESFMRV